MISRAQYRTFHTDRFIAHAGTEKAIKECDYIIKMAGLKSRPDSLIIVGESGFGKSALLSEIFENATRHTYLGKNLLDSECLLIEMPIAPTPKALANDIIEALGGVHHAKTDMSYLSQLFSEKGLKLLIIDEFNTLFDATRSDLRKCLNLLKWAGNQHQISIILSGTELIDKILIYDKQFERRFRKIRLKKWRLDDQFKKFIMNYMVSLPVEFAPKINNAIFSELINGTDGSTKRVVWVLCQACLEASLDDDICNLAEYIRIVAERDGHTTD